MARIRDNPKDGPRAPKAERLVCLDALRGACLLALASAGLGVQQLATDTRWGWLAEQARPREWFGCTLGDLLLPAFLVLAGVALPFSYAGRQGQGWPRQLLHAALRAAVLVALGMYLDSYRAGRLTFGLRGELQTLGLAYFLAFLVLPLGAHVQALTALFLLAGHTTAYVVYGGVKGTDAWAPELNAGHALDSWLGAAPHRDHFATLNLLPAAAMVLLGALAGELLRSGLSPARKLLILAAASALGVLLGWLLSGGGGWVGLEWPALIPPVRRLGSASFVFLAVGWTLAVLTLLYLLLDGSGWRAGGLPLAVAGMNSLFLFVTLTLFRGWAHRSVALVVPEWESWAPYRASLADAGVVLLFWLLALWLYRRQIFLKV